MSSCFPWSIDISKLFSIANSKKFENTFQAIRGSSQRIENQIVCGLILKQDKFDFMVRVHVPLGVLPSPFVVG